MTRQRHKRRNERQPYFPKPVICPHCGAEAKCVSSTVIYKHWFGWLWVCSNHPQCDSYVGCHGETKVPLGSPANKETRDARQQAHRAFDPLWRGGGMKRSSAYELMASLLGVDVRKCHIANFDVETCRQVVLIVTRIREVAEKNSSAISQVKGLA